MFSFEESAGVKQGDSVRLEAFKKTGVRYEADGGYWVGVPDLLWILGLATRAVESGERASALMETVKAGDSVEPLWEFVDWLVPRD